MAANPTVFIDGQFGTAGLKLAGLLRRHPFIDLQEINEADRRDPALRGKLIRDVGLTVLCLPDAEASAVVNRAPEGARLLDCGSQFRLRDDWVYGLPELGSEQRDRIRSATRTANPGCFASAFILLIRPLTAMGIIRSDAEVSAFGLAGYSAGGQRMIARYESEQTGSRVHGLAQQHKHAPEMRAYSALAAEPFFIPAVGGHKEGLTVSVPIPGAGRERLLQAYQDAYGAEPLAELKTANTDALSPAFDSGPQFEIYVTGRDGRWLVTARMSNLLKGAAGVAVQNINLMLGFDECLGLS